MISQWWNLPFQNKKKIKQFLYKTICSLCEPKGFFVIRIVHFWIKSDAIVWTVRLDDPLTELKLFLIKMDAARWPG